MAPGWHWRADILCGMNTHSHIRRGGNWPWAVIVALLASIPAFYDSLMPNPSFWANGLYVVSGGVLLASLRRTGTRMTRAIWRSDRAIDVVLALALLSCAVLPASHTSMLALGWRLAVALATLFRMVVLCQPLFSSAGLVRMLAIATGLLLMCGVGFYWIDPSVESLSDGLWLAFTTAATVGYGDVVPSTTASRIFAVFVVLLGYGVLSLVTAGIAAMFVGSQGREVEQEILRDMHTQLGMVRREIAQLREEMLAVRSAAASASENSPHAKTQGDHAAS
jgi:voltage-gated potassium channel